MQSFASSQRKKPAEFPKQLWDRLIPYTAAAGAALLVAAQAAQAKVVYIPINVVVTNGFTIDIAGVPAFTFRSVSFALDENEVFYATGRLGLISAGGSAAKLGAGAVIGPKKAFVAGGLRMDQAYITQCLGRPSSNGNWYAFFGPVTGYLGFKFILNGEPHYGWARLTVAQTYDPKPLTVTLTGYAFETRADRAIVAGEKSGTVVGKAASEPSLGTLAFGSRGLAFWRKN